MFLLFNILYVVYSICYIYNQCIMFSLFNFVFILMVNTLIVVVVYYSIDIIL